MPDPGHTTALDALEHARDACACRRWLEACDSFARADAAAPLEAEDIVLWSTATLMHGRDDDAVALLERAHHRFLERSERLPAVRAAAWIGMNLAYRGAVGPANGWLARAQRLLSEESGESAEHGYLLVPQVFRHEAAGDFEAAAALAGEAAALGRSHGDRDLHALALHAQGQMLVMAGHVDDGFALLDEAMVAVTTGELSPFVVGIVYCGVILACQSVFDVGRAREWTLALTEWADEQQDLVAFTGRCLLHRAEILQLSGSWPDALDEARLAGERFLETSNPVAGLAHYRQAEVLRLLGDFAAAEQAYREASRLGWEPQPGLAQLRLGQGRIEAALAAIRRASAETADPLKRLTLLPAHVEIALAAGEIDEARTACGELAELGKRYESPMLGAMLDHERGAVALAGGDARDAVGSLRNAQRVWLELDAPYEVARTRALLAQACALLGDEEAATLELEAATDIFRRLGAIPDLERLQPRPGRGRREAHGLSRREVEVLRLVARGMSNREVAASLVISEHTVARHLQNIYGKLGLSSRSAATAFAFERELV